MDTSYFPSSIPTRPRASASLSHHPISLAKKVEIIKAVESSQKSKS